MNKVEQGTVLGQYQDCLIRSVSALQPSASVNSFGAIQTVLPGGEFKSSYQHKSRSIKNLQLNTIGINLTSLSLWSSFGLFSILSLTATAHSSKESLNSFYLW